MKISELEIGKRADIEGTITEIGNVKSFTKLGRLIRVATAKIKDDSGEVNLTLWNKDIDRIKVGDKVKLTNGFVKEFEGKMCLTAGKFGKIEVVK